MKIIFNKYHGTGNDFILIDNRKGIFNPRDHTIIKLMCDRHRGIGADGLILMADHSEYDFEMKYFNSDGKPGSMCGNGGRCAVAFASKAEFGKGINKFMAIDGVHQFRIDNDDISVSLNDTEPPSMINGNMFIDTGSPHYIIYVPDCDNVNVKETGSKIRYSDNFAPEGVNINFVERRNDEIFVRTYERGVEDETLSCGTGISAAAISSKWNDGKGSYKVGVGTRGGKLEVKFEITENKIKSICLTGPAEFVFAGVFEY